MILLDDRLGSRDLAHYPPMNDDSLVTLTRLDSGDVAFTGNGPRGTVLVGVEAKKLPDLISSIATGRLAATQVCDPQTGMLSTYEVRWLLYWGTYRCGRGGELEVVGGRARGGGLTWRPYALGRRVFKYAYLEKHLLTLSDAGVQHKHVYDIEQAARWLGVLYDRWQQPYEAHRSLHVFDNSRGVGLVPGMDAKTRMMAEVASKLPGVGYTRAVAAANHFGSVRAMVNADAREWAAVDGIGKVVSRAIVEAVS